jgi:hypothetical protein
LEKYPGRFLEDPLSGTNHRNFFGYPKDVAYP